MPDREIARVEDEERDFYGRRYWFEYQERELGNPDITVRARTDLPERCVYWLRTVLTYKLPPGRVLELGSAHGAFVAMLRWAGFDATGLELSPWVVQFIRETFQVPVLLGPVEDQQIEPASLDVIALMDVLEHLSDPESTMRHCLGLLKPDGILLIQTPCYPEGRTYDEMVAQHDRFLEMLKPTDHLYLFSRRSIHDLFRRLGADYVAFEPAIFAEYDMFVVVSRVPLVTLGPAEIDATLSARPAGRMIQALLDLDVARRDLGRRYVESETDRAARLEVIHEQGRRLSVLEHELAELRRHLNEIEGDRAARLRVIHEQADRLQALAAERETLRAELATLRFRDVRLMARKVIRGVCAGGRALTALLARRRAAPPPAADLVTVTPPATPATSAAPPGLPPSAPVTVHESLDDYVRTIDAFARTRLDLVPVRDYNHAMVDVLDATVPLAGRTLLDVGASPHGFSLERALAKGAAAYLGVGLGVWEPVEVRHQRAVGRLVAAYGETLPLEPESVDLVMSLSTFEHFTDGAGVLREIHRVLRPGGKLFANFQPVWTSSAGHHLHHIESVARVIPPWAHLLWTPATMRRALESRWPADAPMSLDEAVAWIYESSEINRVDVVTLRRMFETAPLTIEWMTPLLEDESGDRPRLAAYLATLLPHSAEELLTRGFSIMMRKRKA